MTLEQHAVRWLRFRIRCPIIICERDPAPIIGSRPDVLGVHRNRKRIEIEVKRTLADLRRNEDKRHVRDRERWINRWPWKYYFLVPQDLASATVPEWAGLLYVDDYQVHVSKSAPANNESLRLSVKQCCRLVELVANQLVSQMGINSSDDKPDYEI